MAKKHKIYIESLEIDGFFPRLTKNGSAGDDKLTGSSGNDTLDGKAGDDKVAGLGGNDKLKGDVGNDTLDGGDGNDSLDGGTGTNRVIGGSGTDTVVLAGNAEDWGVSHLAKGDIRFTIKGTTTTIDATVEVIKFGDLTINRAAPAAPVITGIGTENGTIGDGGISIDDTVTIVGTSDPFARISLSLGGESIGTATADRNGNWSFDYTGTKLGEGAYNITATADFGVKGAQSSEVDFDFTVGHVLDIATLTQAQGNVFEGEGEAAGREVAVLGDINGDGFADFLIGAMRTGRGNAYIVFGTEAGIGSVDGAGRQVQALESLYSSQVITITGENNYDGLAISAAAAGDVNGDGFDDFILAANGGDLGGDGSGQAYIVFGKASGLGGNLNLGSLGPSQGFIIQGDAFHDYLGAVSSAGDINGDGFDDLIVGARGGDDGGYNAGEAYVVFGTDQGFGVGSARKILDLSSLTASQGFIIQGDYAGDRAGISVSSAGDVNGDGFDDMIVGAHYGDDGGTSAGEAYVLFGLSTAGLSSRADVDLSTVSASRGFVIQGDAESDSTGFSVSSAGDVNGDGFDDLLVGARWGGDGGVTAGEAYVVFGTDQGFGTADGAGRQVIDLTSLTAAQGFVIQGDTESDEAGYSVSGAGDFNGDGFEDLLVGARNASDKGEAYVIFGTDQGFGTATGGRQVIDVSNLTLAQGFIIRGDDANDGAGYSVSGGGDINGDGFDDLIVGAKYASSTNYSNGQAYIIYGGAFGTSTRAVKQTGTIAAEMMLGGAGNDTLDGAGGADRFRSGSGNDTIRVADNKFLLIDAGLGQDTVVITKKNVTINGRNWSNGELGGIEAFDLTGTGNNKLILEASDVFHFSTNANSAFSAANSHNSLVVSGNAGDILELYDDTTSALTWELVASDKALSGSKKGEFDFYDLSSFEGDVYASIAVDRDMTVNIVTDV